MPKTRRSGATQRKEMLIYDALFSGLSPQQVAARFQRTVSQVLAIEERVLSQREAEGAAVVVREEQRDTIRTLRRTSLRAFHEVYIEGEETTRVSMEKEKQGEVRKAERLVRKRSDPRFLRIAMDTLTVEAKLFPSAPALRPATAQDPEPEPVPEPLVGPDISEAQRQEMIQHPGYQDYVDSQHEMLTGMKRPNIDMSVFDYPVEGEQHS